MRFEFVRESKVCEDYRINQEFLNMTVLSFTANHQFFGQKAERPKRPGNHY